jgi:hypothetical protein
MMQHSPGVEHDDVLKELIGFLEACRPRMVELIEVSQASSHCDCMPVAVFVRAHLCQ